MDIERMGEAMFKMYDLNGDGSVGRKEYEEAARKMME